LIITGFGSCSLHSDHTATGTARTTQKSEEPSEGAGRPCRLRLISLVAVHDGAEACVCELTDPIGLSQPTVSHHLKILVDAGIFSREQRGKWAYYRLMPEALNAVAALIAPPAG
jgi:DNA-binding transcriptional ArsR family regulator